VTGRADSLPPPVERWLATAWPNGMPDIDTMASAGTGRLRIGPLRWLSIEHRTVHRLGRDQVRDIRLRVGSVPVLRVLDAYVDGHGMTKIGPLPSVGPAVDEAAFLAMWCEAALVPSSWRHAPGLRWAPVDDDRAVLHVPFRERVDELAVEFDPGSSLPRAFEVDRPKSEARRVRWRAAFREPVTFGDIRWWRIVSARWMDEPEPWYEAQIDQLRDGPPGRSSRGACPPGARQGSPSGWVGWWCVNRAPSMAPAT
jgi:hypothetical protein